MSIDGNMEIKMDQEYDIPADYSQLSPEDWAYGKARADGFSRVGIQNIALVIADDKYTRIELSYYKLSDLISAAGGFTKGITSICLT